ncbi:hypothetical protein IW140_006419 [Coemansia sp. RSA 1813]|nr:hypothetical protein IW140_006419 [Coemansia sp. RSA 1813]
MTFKLRVKERTVGAQSSGTKLRNFIVHEFRQDLVIRADAIAALRQKRVRVNGSIVLDSYQLEEGDRVQVEVDAMQVIRSRLHSLDVEVRYTENGLVVLAKAPGISRPDVEWAAPALLLVSQETPAMETEARQIKPWIAVNDVEKSIRGLILLVDTEKRRDTVLQYIASGQVTFGICALCHGNVDQGKVGSASAQSISTNANRVTPNGADRLDIWFADNGLPSDVFDSVGAKVVSVVKSSSVGNLSMIEGLVRRAVKPSLVLRRFLYELGYPVVGTQNYSQPLPNHRDKGVLLSIVSIEMPSLADKRTRISVSEKVPPKILAVCDRESKFYQQRQEKARADFANIDHLENPSTSLIVQQPDADPDSTAVLGIDLIEGRPVAYISGFKQFCGYKFHVTPDTLIPRPSTETLVHAAADHLNGINAQCNACGIGVDISSSALDVAIRNCELHSLQNRAMFLKSSFEAFASDPLVLEHGPFDFIACNPPYISDKKASRMRATIGHEPSLALIAEDGGYQAYRDICKSLEANLAMLRDGGCIGFEIGKDMAKGVRRIFGNWQEKDALKDSHGFLRVIIFQRPGSI